MIGRQLIDLDFFPFLTDRLVLDNVTVAILVASV